MGNCYCDCDCSRAPVELAVSSSTGGNSSALAYAYALRWLARRLRSGVRRCDDTDLLDREATTTSCGVISQVLNRWHWWDWLY